MNISIVSGTDKFVPPSLQTQTGKHSDEEGQLPDSSSKKSKDLSKLEKTSKDPKPEDLVMKHSPVSLEEKMEQIISPEEVKDLLSLVTRSPAPKKEEHKVDFKR
ncbi:MAG: hypothetical protein MUF77_11010 [Leptospira sp.]|jgi:hypothetical protein|nr:hypothetical protein [Leptospira sp.]